MDQEEKQILDHDDHDPKVVELEQEPRDHDQEVVEVALVDDYRSNVDTSRPFRSVKEAVAIFGERLLVGEICSPKPPFAFPKKETPFFAPSPMRMDKESSWKYSSPSPRGSSHSHDMTLLDTVKKLESELEETKAELKLLKERESETEVALASLNAELHKNMSKLARAEASAAAKAARSASVRGDQVDGGANTREEEKKRDAFVRMENASLAQILSIGGNEGLFVGKKKEKKMVKKKPIIPLVGDLFSRKKGSSTSLHNPLYGSSPLQWN